MQNYSTNKISEIVNGKLIGKSDNHIKYIILDSRTAIFPNDSLFFAITGERHDGHNYIQEMQTRGVRNFVISSYDKNWSSDENTNFILVENTLTALQKLTAFHRSQFTIPVIGITGSNGKTVLKEWIYQLIADKKVIRSPKSYNSQVGVPLSVWLLEENTELAIFEAGISLIGEMSNLQKIIKPTIGIFTNIGDAHQENFIDHKHKIKEKLKLFVDSDVILYCKDYQIIDNQMQYTKQFDEDRLFTWSTKYPANLFVKSINKQEFQTNIVAIYKSKEIKITIPFSDNASIENALHSWCLMLYLNYDNDYISLQIQKLVSVAMRLELKDGVNNCTIINDSYNSDIGSLSIALDFVNQQQHHLTKTLILSDILQSGKDENILYKEVSELVKKKNIDFLIGIGNSISRNKHYFSMKCIFFPDTDMFIRNIQTHNFHDQIILLKGARQFEFERISNILQQKIHETVLEINLNAVVKNLNFFRSLLKPTTKIMVMVKAFSYGSGIFEIANLLQYQRIDYLAVAFTDEGIELRKAGIHIPIIVLNPEIQSFDAMIQNNLEPEIYSHRILDMFNEAVLRNKVNKFNIHLKLDTGMHRLGFIESDISDLINKITRKDQLHVVSIFSHLAAADEKKHDQFTKQQIEEFNNLSKQIINKLHYPVIRHILNSSGIERFSDYQFDMVRVGIGIYGISSVYKNNLENVSTLKSSISQIKRVEKTDTIGYNRKGKLNETSTIATVPIGYADGLSRKLSNGLGKMLINGKFAPIIGNICMDMCMIDVSNIEAEEGDEVIIFGNDYPITEIAKLLETIPYEIMTGISRRVKRVYFHE
ncbi:MAG: bifunctional UDP-N-acetylmuramoyl-tripeptide:D-alanyl-D-alanine ligase/alanine racemase [Bacteroidota bacterium]